MVAQGEGMGKRWLGLVLALGLMLFAPLAARAATLTVTSTADSGPGTLRAFVGAANPGDTINFAPALDGQTIALSSTINISTNLSIMGPGANLLTISGGNAVRLFFVSSGTVTISGLTIANGSVTGLGGGLVNAGTLTVSNAILSGNSASTGGGGIYNNSGTLTVTNSTFSGNLSNVGGGILVGAGTVTVTNSTFSANSATLEGGALITNGGALTVSNSTIASNTAGSFGGGIYDSGGTVTLTNSIVAGNTTTSDAGDDCDGCGAQSSFNLISTTSSTVNPNLSPLGSYGGTTQTMVPLLNSPALAAGEYMSGEPVTDQRGFPRPSTANAAITLGAVQVESLVVTTTSDSDDVSPGCDSNGDAPCSLRDALTVANSQVTADIVFATGVIGLIDLSNVNTNTPLPAITGNLNLMGPGSNLLTVSGGNSTSVGSVFTVSSDANVEISGITIANGTGVSGGGGIFNSGTLTVNNCTLTGNRGTSGGAIYNFGALAVTNSTLAGNHGIYGGAIRDNGTLTVANSTFTANSGSYGGGIAESGTLTVTNSTFTGNSATASGGAISNAAGSLTLANSLLTGDTGGECINFSGGNGCPSSGGTNGNVVEPTPELPLLAPLGWYGGATQTLLPLPGSQAICAGLPALASGVLTDQRGFPRVNMSYTGSACVDAGSVQTDYQSVQFTMDSYSGFVNQALSPAPIVAVTENGQNIGGVPVSLAVVLGTASDLSGLGPVTTVAGAGATFGSLVATAPNTYAVSASLDVIPNVFAISSLVDLDITSPATITGISAPAINYGQSGMVTVTVTSGVGTVTGNVSLTVDGGTAMSMGLISGQAVFTLNNLTAGSHTLSSSYGAQGIFAASSATGSLQVNPAALTITASSTSMTYGGTPPAVTPGYSAFVGTDTVASLTTAPTCVTTATKSTPAGTDTGANTCSGAVDSNYSFSYAAGNVTVAKATPAIVLVPSINTVLSTNPITLTATVSSPASTPTGSVSFYDGTTLLGSPVTLTGGVATYTTSNLAIATHSLTAVYSGDSNFVTVTSSTVTENVIDFTLNIPSGGLGSITTVPGGSATYTFTVSPATGTTFPSAVTFTISGLPSGATATITPSSIPAGSGAANVNVSVHLGGSALVVPGGPGGEGGRQSGEGGRQKAEGGVPGAPLGAGLALAMIGGMLVVALTFRSAYADPSASSRHALKVGAAFARRPAGRPGSFAVLLLLGAAACVILGITGCGGGGTTSTVVQSQTYTLTITATSGNLSHSTTATLVVE